MSILFRAWLPLFCAALCAAPAALAAGRAATLVGHDARLEGMAGVGSPMEAGALALNANPAALSGLEAPELAFSHHAWLAGTHLEDLAWALPLGEGLPDLGGLAARSHEAREVVGGRLVALSLDAEQEGREERGRRDAHRGGISWGKCRWSE